MTTKPGFINPSPGVVTFPSPPLAMFLVTDGEGEDIDILETDGIPGDTPLTPG